MTKLIWGWGEKRHPALVDTMMSHPDPHYRISAPIPPGVIIG